MTVDDLQQLREGWEAPPAPHPAIRSGARAALLARAASSHAERRLTGPLSRRRVLGLAGTTGAASALVGVGLLVAGTRDAPAGRATGQAPEASPLVSDAADVLTVANGAAEQAGGAPDPVPGPDQWIYAKIAVAKDGARAATHEEWFRARLGRHPEKDRWGLHTDYTYLLTLPTDPAALLARIGHDAPRVADTARGRFLSLYLIARDAPILPPGLRPALYRALALIPGVGIEHGVTDAAGRLGVALTWVETQRTGPKDDKVQTRVEAAFLFDPTTYRFLGERDTSTDVHGARQAYASAILTTGVVDHDGERP